MWENEKLYSRSQRFADFWFSVDVNDLHPQSDYLKNHIADVSPEIGVILQLVVRQNLRRVLVHFVEEVIVKLLVVILLNQLLRDADQALFVR